MSLTSSEQYQGHAVWYDQIGRVQNLLEARVMLSLCDTVHPCHGNEVASIMLGNPVFHLLDYISDLNRIYVNPKHLKHEGSRELRGNDR